MKKTIILSSLALALCVGASAQDQVLGGRVLLGSEFTFTDMITLSQTQYTLGTARTSAMGGAFSSLGADISSMSINPAGLGMYRGSDFAFSLSGGNSVMKSSFSDPYAGDKMRNSQGNFAFNNIGVALEVFRGSGALTSMSFGVGYNRLADFNSVSSMQLYDRPSTIANAFTNMLRGIPEGNLVTDSRPFQNRNIPVNHWGAVMGYQSYRLEDDGTASNQYRITDYQNPAWVNPYLRSKNEGAIGEYSLGLGFNFSNVVYMGFSVGIQDIYYRMTEQYEEGYDYEVPNNDGQQLNYMLYDQYIRMAGTGVNFKFGLIVRPVDPLRLSVAVHSPTMVTFDREYSGEMFNDFKVGDSGYSDTDVLIEEMRFNSPPKLMFGASWTFGQYAILSADYEKAWFNGMRLIDESYQVEEYFKADAKEYCKGSDNLRVGLEVKPVPMLALRAGYGYYGSPLKGTFGEVPFNNPVRTKSQTMSAGIGFRFSNVTFDLAYVRTDSDYTGYDFYYYDGVNNAGDPVTFAQDGYVTQKRGQNNIIFTCGIRF